MHSLQTKYLLFTIPCDEGDAREGAGASYTRTRFLYLLK